MKIFLGLIMTLTFFTTFTVGSICNGLIRYPNFPIEYYFSLGKIILNGGAAILFTGIFVFLTPIFSNISLFKKVIIRLAVANSLLCGILPFLIYSLSSQNSVTIIYNYYSWTIIAVSLLILIGAIYISRHRQD